ncbi:MAG TPA: hypothetical protein VFS43_24250 [Polyangiaceae bacterium]|nr:hypothetical protein [Polyangiaceae bacterium]
MNVRRTGDWALARRLLAAAPARLKAGVERGLRQEAELLRKGIVDGLTSQAPGGKPLAPPAPRTLAARKLTGFGGTKSLVVRGDLRNAIAVVARGDTVFVGVPRSARGKKGAPLVRVAEVHEFGSAPTVIPLTPRMRRFLFALLRHAGEAPRGGAGGGVVVVRIPPRPFLRPAFDAFRKDAGARFLRRVALALGLAPGVEP